MAFAGTLLDLRKLSSPDGFAVLGGFASLGDGGGGLWYWDPAATDADDAGTTVAVGGVMTGRWRRFLEDHVNVRWFGATGDGSAADDAAIQAAIDFAAKRQSKCRVLVPPGVYRITKPLVIGDRQWGLILEGNSTQLADAGQNTIIECDLPPRSSGSAAQIVVTAGETTTDPYGTPVPSATVKGLSGMVATDPGSWLFFEGSTSPGGENNGAFQILAFIDATSVKVEAGDAVSESGLQWTLATDAALRIMSRECLVRGLVFRPAKGRTVFAGVSDMKGTATIQTKNCFERVRVSNDAMAGKRFLFGFVHGDNPDQSGWSPWTANGENNEYYLCTARGNVVAGYWCPNLSGQNKKIVFEQCDLSESRYGIWQQAGGLVIRACDLGSCSAAAVRIQNGWCDQLVIADCQSENCARLLDCNTAVSGAQNAQILGGRCNPAAVAADGWFVRFRGPGTLLIQGATFDTDWAPNAKFLVTDPYDSDPKGIRRAQLVAIGSAFPNDAPFANDVNQGHVRTVIGCTCARPDGTGSNHLPNELGAWVP